MIGWLFAPTIKCSWGTWNATPISETVPAAEPGQTDHARLQESEGFFSKLGTGVKACYAKTPFFGQEEWKLDLLYAFAGIGALCYAASYFSSRRRRGYS
jgi:hypothetical protein